MRQFLSIFFVAFSVTFIASQSMAVAQTMDAIVSDRIRVKFKPEYSVSVERFMKKSGGARTASTYRGSGIALIEKINADMPVKNMRRVFPDAGLYEQRHRMHDLHLWYEIAVNDQPPSAILSLCHTLSSQGEIEIIEPVRKKILRDYRVSAVVSEKSLRLDTPRFDVPNKKRKSFEARTFSQSTQREQTDFPNDPAFPWQWHYNNTGQTGGTPGADISLQQAWKEQTGNRDVIVQIVDSGIDMEHPDIADNLWVNPSPGEGGYPNDIHGFNFVDWNSDVDDKDGHGTHVAGIVGAVTNNGIGVSGVAGGSGNNDGVRLMASRVFSENGSGGFGEAIVYGADHGAVISQNSWSYTNSGDYEQVVLDAIDYFIENAGFDVNQNPVGPMQGGVVIFAAGNYGVNDITYPAYYSPVVAVASTSHADKKASHSNFGDWVDITAPGGDITLADASDGVLSTWIDGQYAYMHGTSMACPHVSGVAALIVSQFKGNLKNSDVVNRLLTSVTDIYSENQDFIDELGTGKLNAFFAVQKDDDGIPPAAITDLAMDSVSQTSLFLSWTATGSSETEGVASRYEIRYSIFPIDETNFEDGALVNFSRLPKIAGRKENHIISELPPGGAYYIALKAYDFFRNVSPLSNVVSGSTAPGPISLLSHDSISAVADHQSVTKVDASINIQNNGQLPLDYSFTIDQKNGWTDSLSYENATESYFLGSESGGFSSAAKFVSSEDFLLTYMKFSLYLQKGNNFMFRLLKGGNKPEHGVEVYEQPISNVFDEDGGFVSFRINTPQNLEAGQTYWLVFDFSTAAYQGVTFIGTKERTFYISVDGGLTYYDLQGAGYPWGFLQVRAMTGPEWIDITPDEGSIATGQQTPATVHFDGSNLPDGNYKAIISFHSNDPLKPEQQIAASLEVKRGIPEIDISAISAFETVMVGDSSSQSIRIRNVGSGPLVLDTLYVTNTVFEIDTLTFPNTITGKSYIDVPLKFVPTSTGNFSANIMVGSDDEDESIVMIALNGEALSAPAFTMSHSEINETLSIGEKKSLQLTLTNEGLSNLEIELGGEFKNPLADTPGDSIHFGGPDRSGYSWIDSKADHGPDYMWEDISNDGSPIYFLTDDQDYYLTNPLVFPFYNRGVYEMRISANGFVLLENSRILDPFGAFENETLLQRSGPSFILAPLWDDLYQDDESEIFLKVKDDNLVIQFNKIKTHSGPGTYTFQTVINRSGSILFNYHTISAPAASASVGIKGPLYDQANEKYSAGGLQMAFNKPYLIDSLSILITPPIYCIVRPHERTYSIPPGESVTANIDLNAYHENAGTFSGELIFKTNDPHRTSVSIPITATVEAEEPVIITQLEDLVLVLERDSINKSVTDLFSVANGYEMNVDVFNETNAVAEVLVENGTFKINPISEGYSKAWIFCNNGRGQEVGYDFTVQVVSMQDDDLITGVEDPEGLLKMKVFPNPSTDRFALAFNVARNQSDVQVAIQDLHGRPTSIPFEGAMDSGNKELNINTSHLRAGLYVVRLRVNGNEQFLKLLKQ